MAENQEEIKQLIVQLDKEIENLPPISEKAESILDVIASLLVDDFIDKLQTQELRN